MSADPILILKTGALGDVLRTTSILDGLHTRHPERPIEWLTAPGAVELVRGHPLVARTHALDPNDAEQRARCARVLGKRKWGWLLSFDDERGLCELASSLGAQRLTGAYLDANGERAYTDDAAPWFDMGLISRLGKTQADRLKRVNTQSHPAIFASMLGVEMGRPALVIEPRAQQRAANLFARAELGKRPVVGLNTGAGGRWPSKQLTVERTVELAHELAARRPGGLDFLVLGGPPERARNDAILAALASAAPERLRAIDAGTDNEIPDFVALVDRCRLLVTSDSLALHVAVARQVPVVAFFAPTSAAEIELYGGGIKVASTAPDYCTYAADVDTSSLTAARLADAAYELFPQWRDEGAAR